MDPPIGKQVAQPHEIIQTPRGMDADIKRVATDGAKSSNGPVLEDTRKAELVVDWFCGVPGPQENLKSATEGMDCCVRSSPYPSRIVPAARPDEEIREYFPCDRNIDLAALTLAASAPEEFGDVRPAASTATQGAERTCDRSESSEPSTVQDCQQPQSELSPDNASPNHAVPELELVPVMQQRLVRVPPRLHYYLSGDPLESMMAPGDLLVVRGQGRLMEIGNAGGFLGHVLLVLATPTKIARGSEAASALKGVWPSSRYPGVAELWRVRTAESTRRESGLYECDVLFFVDRKSRKLMVAGEVSLSNEIAATEAPEPAELWQSPEELRSELRIDLMTKVLAEMRASQGNWSMATGLKAVFKVAGLAKDMKPDPRALEELKSCWEKPPICTSVPICFWQRYIEKLAVESCNVASVSSFILEGERVSYWSKKKCTWCDAVVTGRNLDAGGNIVDYNLDVRSSIPANRVRRPVHTRDTSLMTVELILRYIPLKADRSLPGDLLKTLKECDWVPLVQVPRSFRSAVVQPPPMIIHTPLFVQAPQPQPTPPDQAAEESSADPAEKDCSWDKSADHTQPPDKMTGQAADAGNEAKTPHRAEGTPPATLPTQPDEQDEQEKIEEITRLSTRKPPALPDQLSPPSEFLGGAGERRRSHRDPCPGIQTDNLLSMGFLSTLAKILPLPTQDTPHVSSTEPSPEPVAQIDQMAFDSSGKCTDPVFQAL